MDDIKRFVDGIKAAGVRITSENVLMKELTSAEDWRGAFNGLVFRGRHVGVTFFGRGVDASEVNVLAVGMVFGAAGFSLLNAKQFISNVFPEPTPEVWVEPARAEA